MAADSSTLGMLGAGTSGADLVSGRSPAARNNPSSSGVGARSSAAFGIGTTSGGADVNASASQHGQSSSDGSSPSGANTNSAASTGSKPSGKDGPSASGNSSGAADAGRSARSCGGSKSGSSQPNSQGSAPAGAQGNDFPAALAQSLAATTAGSGATADGDGATLDDPAGKPVSPSNAGDSTEPGKAHSASDPAASALTLLEQALAGALTGALAGIQAAAAAGATAASPGTTPAADGDAVGGPGRSGTAALDALLTQSLAAESKTSGAIAASAGGTSPAAAAPATASTAAAGLTAAAQLSSAALAGSQQGALSAGMAIASPVGTSAWTDELGAKVTWMAHQGIESASLHLSPEHLGPLQVSISVHDGQASVWFGAAQPDTRTALQQSLPQLRQLFATQGLTLADTGVSRDPPRGQSQQSSGRAAAPVSAIGPVSIDNSDTRISVARGLGLLDTYA